jgi:uncharacterized membrane protein YfcA
MLLSSLTYAFDTSDNEVVDSPAWLVSGGVAVGLLYGIFGVGSAFATPVLSLLGVPGMAAVVGPLPALLPGSAAGAWSYSRQGKVNWRIARLTIAGALPAAILGSIASPWVGGPLLLLASGAVLLLVGLRILRPGSVGDPEDIARRRARTAFILTSAVVIGFASGLLANGGGFLLVPLFLLGLGLDINQAAGTSLVVATSLTVPTLITHAVVGDVNWMVAGLFAAGMIPGVVAGSRLAPRLPTARLRTSFGMLLVGFAVWFLIRQALAIVG